MRTIKGVLDEAAADGIIDADTHLLLRKELDELCVAAQKSLASENVAKDSTPKVSQERAQATEAARIVKMWDDGFTQLAGSRAVELLRNASPSRERGEQECPHGVDDGACKQCYGEAVRGVQGAAYRYIVIGYGETDYPQAELVATHDELLDAVLGMMYTKPSDADAEIREAYRKDIDDEDEWCGNVWRTEFEIGGITIYDLGGEFPLSACAASAPTLGGQPQAAEPKGLTDERAEFLAYWCEEVPDYMREKWKENVDQCLQDGNATEKLSAAWDAWQARALLANGE